MKTPNKKILLSLATLSAMTISGCSAASAQEIMSDFYATVPSPATTAPATAAPAAPIAVQTTTTTTETVNGTPQSTSTQTTSVVQQPAQPNVVTVPAAPVITSTEPVYDNASLTDSDPVILEPQSQGSVTYIVGGVGERERKAMMQAEKQYNLKILNANAKSMLVSASDVTIKNSKGTTLLQTAAGPVILAKLPAGTYNVTVTEGGRTQTKKLSVASRGLKRINFIW